MPAVFTVQDNTGQVVNANAYISVAFFRQYHLDRGRDLTSTNDATVQVGIVRATDYIDQRFKLLFPGEKLLVSVPVVGVTQTTEWPRDDSFYDDGTQITGLPVELQKACAEYAKRALTSELIFDVPPQVDSTGTLQPSGMIVEKQETVGPVTERTRYSEYVPTGGPSTILVNGAYFFIIPAGDLLMEPLLEQGSMQARVIRT